MAEKEDGLPGPLLLSYDPLLILSVDTPRPGRAKLPADDPVTCGRRQSDVCALAFREDVQPPWPMLRLTLLLPPSLDSGRRERIVLLCTERLMTCTRSLRE